MRFTTGWWEAVEGECSLLLLSASLPNIILYSWSGNLQLLPFTVLKSLGNIKAYHCHPLIICEVLLEKLEKTAFDQKLLKMNVANTACGDI